MKILVFAENTPSARILLEQLQQLDGGYQIVVHSWPVENVDASLLGDAQLVLLHGASDISPAQLAVLRRVIRIPIFLVTSLLDEKTLVQLYAAGMDDHLALPTSQPMLAAKLRVWQRWLARVSSPVYH